MGIDPAHANELRGWADEAFGQDIRWQNTFFSLEPAIEVRERFILTTQQSWITTCVVSDKDREMLLETSGPKIADIGQSGALEAIRRGLTVSTKMVRVGYEVLSWELINDVGESWVNDGVAAAVIMRRQVELNELGLIPTAELAAAICRDLDRGRYPNAEEGPWFVGAIHVLSNPTTACS